MFYFKTDLFTEYSASVQYLRGEHEMRVKDIRMDAVYVGAGPLEGAPGFLYLRGYRNGEVGFSVLDDDVDDPDFSESGIFWLEPKVFAEVTKIHRILSDYADPDGGFC